MHTTHSENSLLGSIQSGYRAGQRLRNIYYATEGIQNYMSATCHQLSVRYYDTIRDNAFEAALLYASKTDDKVASAQFEQKFRQYFEEQLLIFCYRKQSASSQTAIANGLSQLLSTSEQYVRQNLMGRFSGVPAEEIRDLVRNATVVTLQRLKEPTFKLTCSLRTFLLETARHMTLQLVDEKQPMRKPIKSEKVKREVEHQQEIYFQQLAGVAQQYIQEKSSSTCQAFLEVYWQLKSPFDFSDPVTRQPIREVMIQERLELTDQQMMRLKNNTLKLSQSEAFQLVSGKKRRKQKANDFYQDCIGKLLRYVGEQANISWLIKDSSMLTTKEEEYVAEFKKTLKKWMRTTRKNPTTTY